jgi:hypothetical protein
MGSSNYNNDEGNNTLYKSRPNERSVEKSSFDRDDDRKSSLTRKSSTKSIKGGKKQILGMNTFKESS